MTNPRWSKCGGIPNVVFLNAWHPGINWVAMELKNHHSNYEGMPELVRSEIEKQLKAAQLIADEAIYRMMWEATK